MTSEQQRADALRRSNFYFFVVEAFRILHPGTSASGSGQSRFCQGSLT